MNEMNSSTYIYLYTHTHTDTRAFKYAPAPVPTYFYTFANTPAYTIAVIQHRENILDGLSIHYRLFEQGNSVTTLVHNSTLNGEILR